MSGPGNWGQMALAKLKYANTATLITLLAFYPVVHAGWVGGLTQIFPRQSFVKARCSCQGFSSLHFSFKKTLKCFVFFSPEVTADHLNMW